MSGATTAVMVGAMAATAAGVYNAAKQSSASKKAAKAQEDASNRQLASQQQEYNRANQRQVDISNLLEQNSGSEVGATMLTGGGVNRDQLSLGKGYNLLGG